MQKQIRAKIFDKFYDKFAEEDLVLLNGIAEYAVQLLKEQRDSDIDKLEKLMDKETARKIGDNLEKSFGSRCCQYCGANPEFQRELIINTLKGKHEKTKRKSSL